MSWCVTMTESERGWGQRIDEILVFGPDGKDREAAEKYAREYNAEHNTAESAPDWYIKAGDPFWVDGDPVGGKFRQMIKEPS